MKKQLFEIVSDLTIEQIQEAIKNLPSLSTATITFKECHEEKHGSESSVNGKIQASSSGKNHSGTHENNALITHRSSQPHIHRNSTSNSVDHNTSNNSIPHSHQSHPSHTQHNNISNNNHTTTASTTGRHNSITSTTATSNNTTTTTAIPTTNETAAITSNTTKLLKEIEIKNKKIKDYDSMIIKLNTSIQAFHLQQQALFDEFVLLRTKYDNQKMMLIEILWNQCLPYHPELLNIPQFDEENCPIDDGTHFGHYTALDILGDGQFATVRKCIYNSNSNSNSNGMSSYNSSTKVLESINVINTSRGEGREGGRNSVLGSKNPSFRSIPVDNTINNTNTTTTSSTSSSSNHNGTNEVLTGRRNNSIVVNDDNISNKLPYIKQTTTTTPATKRRVSISYDTNIDTTKEMAIKIIHKEKLLNFNALKRLSNEIKNLWKLKKNNYIIQLYDVIHTKINLCLILEKGGVDLFEYFSIYMDGVEEGAIRRLIGDILRGILYCHRHSICHRDLKPENILIEYNKDTKDIQSIKLCDFGLSTTFYPHITLTEFCGSPGFFDPEMIIEGNYFGDKADIWSIGCILLEAMLGHSQFGKLWMPSYDYDLMQDAEQFRQLLSTTCEELPRHLPYSEELNDFLFHFIMIDSTIRSTLYTICTHTWLQDSLLNDLKEMTSLSLSTLPHINTNASSTTTTVERNKAIKSYSTNDLSLPPLKAPRTPCVDSAKRKLIRRSHTLFDENEVDTDEDFPPHHHSNDDNYNYGNTDNPVSNTHKNNDNDNEHNSSSNSSTYRNDPVSRQDDPSVLSNTYSISHNSLSSQISTSNQDPNRDNTTIKITDALLHLNLDKSDKSNDGNTEVNVQNHLNDSPIKHIDGDYITKNILTLPKINSEDSQDPLDNTPPTTTTNTTTANDATETNTTKDVFPEEYLSEHNYIRDGVLYFRKPQHDISFKISTSRELLETHRSTTSNNSHTSYSNSNTSRPDTTRSNVSIHNSTTNLNQNIENGQKKDIFLSKDSLHPHRSSSQFLIHHQKSMKVVAQLEEKFALENSGNPSPNSLNSSPSKNSIRRMSPDSHRSTNSRNNKKSDNINTMKIQDDNLNSASTDLDT